jgi:DnaJ-domain-containing protein 1
MLSSVLHSPQAVQVNTEIMRTFVRLRQMLASHADLAERLESLEQKYDEQFRSVFDAIRQLMSPDADEKESIGFKVKEEAGEYQ